MIQVTVHPDDASPTHLVMTIDPQATADEVAARYVEVREQIFHRRRSHPLSARTQAVYAFVEHWSVDGCHPSWRSLWQTWNATVSEAWRFKSHKHFRLYYQRGKAGSKPTNQEEV